jgi:retinol dehydrogenase-13
VNNAAVMRTKKRTVTKEGFETQFGVNHLGAGHEIAFILFTKSIIAFSLKTNAGHFLLTNLLLENLKLNDTPARIINVTCTDYKNAQINFDDINWDRSFDTNKAYKQSKLANVLFTQELAERLTGSKVTAISVRPPNCRTEIKRHLSYYTSWFGFIPRGVFWLLEYSAPQGAESVLHACLAPEFGDPGKSGLMTHNGREEAPLLSADARLQAKKLWLISEKWTRLAQNLQKLQQIKVESVSSVSRPADSTVEPN